jgi:hypothetical protein
MLFLLAIHMCHLLAQAFECTAYPRVHITIQLNYLGSSMDLSCIWFVLAGCWCIVHQDRSVCLCHGSHIHSSLPDVLVYDIRETDMDTMLYHN